MLHLVQKNSSMLLKQIVHTPKDVCRLNTFFKGQVSDLWTLFQECLQSWRIMERALIYPNIPLLKYCTYQTKVGIFINWTKKRDNQYLYFCRKKWFNFMHPFGWRLASNEGFILSRMCGLLSVVVLWRLFLWYWTSGAFARHWLGEPKNKIFRLGIEVGTPNWEIKMHFR